MREVRRLVPGMRERAAAADREGRFPEADFAQLRHIGLLGLMAPKRLGGSGADFSEYAEIAFHLGRGNGAVGLVFNMHVAATGALARISQSEVEALGADPKYFEHRDAVLAAAAEGELYAVAMSERGVGARLSRMSTRYEPEGRGWRIKGRKSFVSGAGHASAYLVAARNAEGAASQFLVPAGPGVEVDPVWDAMGMRATVSHDLDLDVHVEHSALVGGVEGLALAAAELAPQWMVSSYAAVYAGVARSAIELAGEQLRERGLEEHPAVRARIGRADALAAGAEATVREAAGRVDAGDPQAPRWVWRAKLAAGDAAAAVTASMMEACGASAIRSGNHLERLYRDARCGSLQPPPSDVCADWLGASALGADPYAETAAGPRW